MPTALHRGCAISYEVRGQAEAPPLLLIMGLGFSSRGWATLPDRLAERWRVITFDNRGTGASGGVRWPLRLGLLADDAAAVLDAAGVPSACVFGISMGGMIAQELVLRHPQRVSALALGCTYASWRASRKAERAVIRDLVSLRLGDRARGEERLARALASLEFLAAHPGRLARWQREGLPAPLRSVLLHLLAIFRHDTTARLGRIAVPTLVVTGGADKLVPPENSQALVRAIPGARLVVFPGAGHLFPLEREDETVRALEAHFLAALGARAA